MKSIIVASLIIVLSGCVDPQKNYNPDHSVYLKPNEELIYCVSAYNIPSELLYYKSGQVENKIEVPQEAEPFSSYYITDVLGEVYSINSDEISNYTCSKVVKR